MTSKPTMLSSSKKMRSPSPAEEAMLHLNLQLQQQLLVSTPAWVPEILLL